MPLVELTRQVFEVRIDLDDFNFASLLLVDDCDKVHVCFYVAGTLPQLAGGEVVDKLHGF